MPKFLKPGKVVILLAGRYAGRKAVIVRTSDEGTGSRRYGHAVVAGIDRYPLKVCVVGMVGWFGVRGVLGDGKDASAGAGDVLVFFPSLAAFARVGLSLPLTALPTCLFRLSSWSPTARLPATWVRRSRRSAARLSRSSR